MAILTQCSWVKNMPLHRRSSTFFKALLLTWFQFYLHLLDLTWLLCGPNWVIFSEIKEIFMTHWTKYSTTVLVKINSFFTVFLPFLTSFLHIQFWEKFALFLFKKLSLFSILTITYISCGNWNTECIFQIWSFLQFPPENNDQERLFTSYSRWPP